MSSRDEQKGLAHASRAAAELALSEASWSIADPTTLLLYEIMRRGSMLPTTLEYVISQVALHTVAEPKSTQEQAHWAVANRLARQLPWSSA